MTMNCLYYSAIPEATIHILISMAKVNSNMLKNQLCPRRRDFDILHQHSPCRSYQQGSQGERFEVPRPLCVKRLGREG